MPPFNESRLAEKCCGVNAFKVLVEKPQENTAYGTSRRIWGIILKCILQK
jgi:hypothetical protein